MKLELELTDEQKVKAWDALIDFRNKMDTDSQKLQDSAQKRAAHYVATMDIIIKTVTFVATLDFGAFLKKDG